MVENTNESTSTALVLVEKEKHAKVIIPSCIFLLFAEYLGYISPLIDWAEECCTKKDFPSYKKDILNVDAKSILKRIKIDYEEDALYDIYDQFYNVALKIWEKKYNETILS